MGRKVHPIGFRIGVIQDWQAKWYADRNFVEFLHEDLKLRQAIQSGYREAGVSRVEIERQSNKVSVTIHTSRPGIVIGRGGQRVDEMRAQLEGLLKKRIQLNIQEIRQPELAAYLVARVIAEQIEHRISYRRAMKQAIFRTMQAGAKGIKISCAGRLGGGEIARHEKAHDGQVPLHTLRADIDYGITEARTTLGRIGIKVWIYKGEVFPEVKVEEEILVESPATEDMKVSPTTQPEAVTPEQEVAVEKAVEPPVKPEVEAEKVEEHVAAATEKVSKPTEVASEQKVESGKIEKPATEPEEKTAKPVKRKRIKPATASIKKKESIKEEAKDVTTQTSEVPQDS